MTESSNESNNTTPTCEHLPTALAPAALAQTELALTADAKACYSCRRSLPLECFARMQVKGAEYRNRRCNQCRAYRANKLPSFLSRKKTMEDLKAAPCADCKRTFPPECMDFDHVRGEKEYNLGSAYRWISEEVFLKEVAKCELVCACCHRTRSKTRKQSRGRPCLFLAEGGSELKNLTSDGLTPSLNSS